MLLHDNHMTPSIMDNNDDSNYSQQLRETKVVINLIDCMQCYVRIPRCQVKLGSYSFSSVNRILTG